MIVKNALFCDALLIIKILLLMRVIFFVISIAIFAISCQVNKQYQKLKVAENYHIYGDTIIVTNGEELTAVNDLYKELALGDTITTTITAKVTEVCKKKGCWMKLDLNQDQDVMVRFKDYGFFVPEDILGKEVILEGMAFVDQVSVEDQQHYASDAGESKEEIAKITTPKNTYTFQAIGVLTKK